MVERASRVAAMEAAAERIDYIEQRSDLAAGNHVFIIGPASSRPGRLSGGVLHELTDFFLERHLFDKRFHPCLKLRIERTDS